MDKRIFAVIGGDKRSIELYKKFTNDGHEARIFGFSEYRNDIIKQSVNLYEAITGAEYIIGPTPCSHNDIALNAIFHNEEIYVDELLRLTKPTQAFIAGYIKPDLFALAEKYNVEVIDMLAREELLLLNAIPTAEGAIKIAIEETEITLHSSDIMVVGYGRVGRTLSKMLNGIGAKVHTVVNTADSAAQAKSDGHEVIYYADIAGDLSKMDIIFNTVPQIILDISNMKYINRSCLVIDLASPPYGVDCLAARTMGVKVLYTNSLPGKIAPITTAKYFANTIYHIINERGDYNGSAR